MARVQTLAGMALRAMALRDGPAINAIQAKLDETGWVDAERVFSSGFKIAMERRFPPGTDVRDISQWVARVTERLGSAKLAPPLEAEALIRNALGESVAIADIHPATVNTVRLVYISEVSGDLDWSLSDMEAFAQAAEQHVIAEGGRPTPTS